jgi:hypothetical protein
LEVSVGSLARPVIVAPGASSNDMFAPLRAAVILAVVIAAVECRLDGAGRHLVRRRRTAVLLRVARRPFDTRRTATSSRMSS